MKVLEKDFRIVKIKIMPNGGLDVTWRHRWYTKTAMIIPEYHLKQEVEPHVDLSQLFDGLKAMIATVFGYNELSEDKFNALSLMIRFTGITISGTDELTSVILTGQKSADLYVLNLVTHPILIQGHQYGFESELGNLIKVITSETYAYLYKDKFDKQYAVQTKLKFEIQDV